MGKNKKLNNETVGPFDRRQLLLKRNRASLNYESHSFLLNEVSLRLSERLNDIMRQFDIALDLGCHDGRLGKYINEHNAIKHLVQCDISERMIKKSPANMRLVADEEYLPFGDAKIDLVASALSLHSVNDLPGTLIQIRKSLKPDGLFLAAMIGGNSLIELRQSLMMTEINLEKGHSPRIAPLIEIKSIGTLLQRAGFALPVVDSDTIHVTYPDARALMRDLRGMGETNIIRERVKTFTRRTTMISAEEYYKKSFGTSNGRIPATFEIIYALGWAPHKSQPKPLKPGSGEISLAQTLSRT